MTLEYFSAFYFIYPALCIAAFVVLFFLLRQRSKQTIYWVLFGILALNFVLHWLKLAFPPYVDELPSSIRKATFENVCAVSTLVFPFFMLSKKPALLDFMFYLGTLSGFLAMFVPLNAIGLGIFEFETIRFYICHGSLWICPLLMVILGVHKPCYRRIFKVIFIYIGYICLILINEVFLMVIGWVAPPEGWEGTAWDYLLSNVERNSGYIFGPPPEMEKIASFILVLVPSFFKPGEYIDCYMPVLWEVVPVFVYATPCLLLLNLIWDREHMASDLRRLADRTELTLKRIRIKMGKSRFRLPKRYIKAKRLKRTCKVRGVRRYLP